MTDSTNGAPTAFKSGYAMLLGRPNVGKSTILNALLGEELAIVTPKPQTTRRRLLGIHTAADHQVIFLDTPGAVNDERGLNRFLGRELQRAWQDADVVILVVEAMGPPRQGEQLLLERLAAGKRPVVLAINKVDKVRKDLLLPLIDDYRQAFAFTAIVPLAARRGVGLDALLAETVAALPVGPLFFPADQLTDASERFLVGEMIREQVFLLTRQEIPYSSAILIEAFRPEKDLVRIAARLVVERDGQKGVVIGRGGAMLKKIGSEARRKIEAFLGKKVFLEVRVAVKKDWTRSESAMREMGYE